MSNIGEALGRLERAVARLEAALEKGPPEGRRTDDERAAAAAGAIAGQIAAQVAERVDAALARLDRLLEPEPEG